MEQWSWSVSRQPHHSGQLDALFLTQAKLLSPGYNEPPLLDFVLSQEREKCCVEKIFTLQNQWGISQRTSLLSWVRSQLTVNNWILPEQHGLGDEEERQSCQSGQKFSLKHTLVDVCMDLSIDVSIVKKCCKNIILQWFVILAVTTSPF